MSIYKQEKHRNITSQDSNCCPSTRLHFSSTSLLGVLLICQVLEVETMEREHVRERESRMYCFYLA